MSYPTTRVIKMGYRDSSLVIDENGITLDCSWDEDQLLDAILSISVEFSRTENVVISYDLLASRHGCLPWFIITFKRMDCELYDVAEHYLEMD